ncbi:lipopolysaccharide kinase InaA family protein [Planctomycetota bacterium]
MSGKFRGISKSFFIYADFEDSFRKAGLNSIDKIFAFKAGKDLSKDNLASYRRRIQFQLDKPPITLFLKRYDNPPILVQLKNWLSLRKRASCALLDFKPTRKLSAAGINTARTVCYGEEWGFFFEKRSFCITEKIAEAESLERKLPEYFTVVDKPVKLKQRRDFIKRLANFIRKFHETGYRHRDLYFSHVFLDGREKFYLIDLARAFEPLVFCEKFRIKDIAQIFYSAPAKYFSKTDRLRFYLRYAAIKRLTTKDKSFIRKVLKKTKRMARHDIKHGRIVPFQSSTDSRRM